MPKGDNLKGKGGVKFSSTNQPSREAKSVPKKITKFKEALAHFAEIKKSTIGDIEFTLESNIAYVLLDKANKGDLQAIKLVIDVFGWNAPSKQEQTIIEKIIVDDLYIEE
jgi:hypothetical protein